MFTLKAATDCATYVVIDSSLGKRLVRGRDFEGDFSHFAAEADLGNLVLFSNASDGFVRFCVFVDEEPGEDIRALSLGLSGEGLLRVPSGILTVSGVEYFLDEFGAETNENIDVVVVTDENIDRDAVKINSGNYLVSSFEIKRMDSPSSWGRCFCCMGCLLVLILPFALYYAFHGAVAAKFICGLFLFYYLTMAVLNSRSSVKKKRDAYEEFERRYPFDVVLLLKSLPSDCDVSGMKGLRFGAGYV